MFSATGKVGKELLKLLSIAEVPTIAVTRNISKTSEMPFVEWMQADLSEKDGLNKCLKGSTAVFLSSGFSPDFVKEQYNAILVAKQAGVSHIVRLSKVAAIEKSANFIARLSGETDQLLMNAVIPYTILKPNAFMQNWLGDFSETIKKERRIYEAAGDGRKAYIDTSDVAEVAFKMLTNGDTNCDKVYQITGGQAVSYHQVADVIGQSIGEKVEYIPLSLDQAKNRMEQRNLPAFLIDTFLSVVRELREDRAHFVSPSVEEILGKPAKTIVDFANDYIAFFE